MYKGRSFNEQKDIMERCSILFNPTDFCLVIFSGDSQQTWQTKTSRFKGGGMFVFVFCCSEHLEGLSYRIWWERTPAFLSGNLSRPAISQSEQVFLQLLFFFYQQPRPGRAFFVNSTVSKHNIKRCHLTQSKDVQTREEKLRILKASATSHESEIKIQTSMGLNTSMHIRGDDHNAIKKAI